MQVGLVLPLFAFLVQVTLVFGTQRFCGKHLSDSLSLICGNRGYYWREDKKTDLFPLYFDIGLPVISKRDAAKFLSRGTRNGKTRGIIQECCDNPCSLAHLENYCSPTDKAFDGSSDDVQRMVVDKPEGSESESLDTEIEDGELQVTSNPHLMSRLEDLRARLRGSGTSRSRLASRRPFFFVRPISPRPIRMNNI